MAGDASVEEDWVKEPRSTANSRAPRSDTARNRRVGVWRQWDGVRLLTVGKVLNGVVSDSVAAPEISASP